MGISEYAFVFYVFALLCLFALLCKLLFGKTKKNMALLEEKEKKLLALYGTMEDMMDEFNDSTTLAKRELDSRIREIRELAITTKTQLQSYEPPPPVERPERREAPIPLKAEAPEKEIVFIPIAQPNPAEERAGSAAAEPAISGGTRSALILNLHQNGLDRLQIAKELAVTLNEVDLVLGIAAQK